MLATTHAIVAGTIAAHTQNPVTAISLSFFSHFVLDAIPHWDFGTDWRKRSKWMTGAIAIADTVMGFVLGILLFKNVVPLPLLCIVIAVSMLPDWMEAPWYIFFAAPKKKEPGKKAGFLEKLCFGIYKTENAIHSKTTFPFGVLTQFAAIAFFLVLLA